MDWLARAPRHLLANNFGVREADLVHFGKRDQGSPPRLTLSNRRLGVLFSDSIEYPKPRPGFSVAPAHGSVPLKSCNKQPQRGAADGSG
jgi:hypothetical protein